MCGIKKQLLEIYGIAMNENYRMDVMITAGLDNILDIYESMMFDDTYCKVFTYKLVISLLPTENSFYELLAEIEKNFSRRKDLACALADMLVELSAYRKHIKANEPEVFQIFSQDSNFKRLFTNPEAIYDNEFSTYYYNADDTSVSSNSSDSDTESIDSIDQFHEDCQALVPSKKEQLERLTNELKIKLCEECLCPYNGQACDCWLQELGESYYQSDSESIPELKTDSESEFESV